MEIREAQRKLGRSYWAKMVVISSRTDGRADYGFIFYISAPHLILNNSLGIFHGSVMRVQNSSEATTPSVFSCLSPQCASNDGELLLLYEKS